MTALGLTLERSVASLRSGLDGFKQSRYAGTSGIKLQFAPIDGFAEGTSGVDRYEALAAPAIEACLASASPAERARTGILLGLPRPERPGVPADLAALLPARLAKRFGLAPNFVRAVSLGRVSALWSLPHAERALREGGLENCIVGGVDVMVNGASLGGLSAVRLLKEEWDGFIPGEAAGFVRLTAAPRTAGTWGSAPARITGAGSAKETAAGSATDPVLGKAVANAFRAAVAETGCSDKDIHLILNDVNGSRASFEDFAMGRIRFFRTPDHGVDVWHVASCLGETGAAVGGIELAWASATLELGLPPGGAILLSASDETARSAALIQAAAAPAGGAPVRVSIGVPALFAKTPATPLPEEPSRTLRLHGDDLHGRLRRRDFEELSWLWSLRASHHLRGTDPWIDIADFERRLLAHLDALAWEGEAGRRAALDHVMSEEPGDAAAAALIVLSRVPDPETVDLLLRTMWQSDLHRHSIAAVLPHVPDAAARPLIEQMMSSSDSGLITEAVRSASLGGWADAQLIERALAAQAPAPDILIAAGIAGVRTMNDRLFHAVNTARSRLSGIARVAMISISDEVDAEGPLSFHQVLASTPVGCALLCLREGMSFLSVAGREALRSSSMLDACGWSGEQPAVPALLDALASREAPEKEAAAAALYRIFGLACFEKAAMVDEISATERGPQDADSSARASSDTPPRTVMRVSQDRSVWEEALRTFYRTPRGEGRLRHGLPWSPRSAIVHLARPDGTFSERLVAAWEYAVVNRSAPPCHPSWFVRRQQQALQGLAS